MTGKHSGTRKGGIPAYGGGIPAVIHLLSTAYVQDMHKPLVTAMGERGIDHFPFPLYSGAIALTGVEP